MATRAIRNLTHVAGSHLDLPAQDRPQLVTENGIETDEATFFGTRDSAAQPEVVESVSVVGEEELETAAFGNEDDNEVLPDDLPNTADPERPPLLSIADSLVASYSLTQSRIHHINNLLPHIFSHPPIPSHSRPRARLPPRSTFQFPTPPPPVHPLPNPEYHGPTASSSSTASGSAKPISDDPSGQAVKAGPSKGKAKEKENQPPAHEIDCIARVTLTIGPISFPNTELWVGRFVEPRSGAPKVQRIKSESKEKRKSNVEPATHKKPRLSSTPSRPAGPLPQRPPPPPRPSALSAGPLSNRPPIRPPGRQEVDPVLIQRVNQAAAKNPWLAVLIHKAARQQASKEELSQLGRAVGKLGRGEDVGPTPDPPSTSTSGPVPPGPSASSSTSARQSAAGVRPPPPPPASTPPVPSAPTITPAPVKPHPKPSEADSDDDSDVDMKGPPQEGGGPIPAALEKEVPVASDQPQTPEHAGKPAAAVAAPAPVPSPSPPGGSGQSVGPGSGPTVLPMPPPTTQVRTDSALQLVQAPTIKRPTESGQRAAPNMMPPPPPPRPVYPMPPPFLLIAFRELPTEKYLLPLGSNSFISRIGGDWVTSPPPPSQISSMVGTASQHLGQPTAETTTITETTPGQTNNTPTSGPPVGPAAVSGRTRARQSVGKPIKAATPPAKESTPPPAAPSVEPPPSSGLDSLPGMEPSPGSVLLSTLIPPTWLQPDWAELGKSIPFGNPAFQVGVSRPPVAVEVKKELLENGESLRPSPSLPSDGDRSLGLPFLLNLGAKDFVPPDAPLQPVTIRLSGIDDKVWHQMKSIISVVEQADVQAIALQDTATSAMKEESQAPTMDAASLAAVLPKFRETWRERRKTRFRDLLRRVPSRKFLRMRLDVPPPDILEATSDRFALRPYPLSTKALYSASPPPDDALPITLSPELSASKRKGPEPTITFEMPVSLDYLDERVEEGARSLTKKAGKKGEALKADGTPDLRKTGLKRGVAGRLCEGCAREGLKVWRMGPGGPSTLCNECGNKYNNGTLGELKAPGSAKTETEEVKEGSAVVDPPQGSDAGQTSSAVPGDASDAVPVPNATGTEAVPSSSEGAGAAAGSEDATEPSDMPATSTGSEALRNEEAVASDSPAIEKPISMVSPEATEPQPSVEVTHLDQIATSAPEAGSTEVVDATAANPDLTPAAGGEALEDDRMEVD